MAIDKSVNQAPKLSVVVDTEETLPDVEVIIEEDGGAVIEIGEQEDKVDFHANLADVIDKDELCHGRIHTRDGSSFVLSRLWRFCV